MYCGCGLNVNIITRKEGSSMDMERQMGHNSISCVDFVIRLTIVDFEI